MLISIMQLVKKESNLRLGPENVEEFKICAYFTTHCFRFREKSGFYAIFTHIISPFKRKNIRLLLCVIEICIVWL